MPLLEREHVTGALEGALHHAPAGRSSVLFVVGEPGLGKTTLLSQCCSTAAARGFHVGMAGCSEPEASLPFGLLDRLLGGVRGTAAPPGGSAAASVEARAGRYSGTLDWLRNAAPAPLLLAIDDLHWADPDSTELLSLLCRRLGGLKVALVATLRPWPPQALEHARWLAHEGAAALEALRPLSEPASAALLADRLGGEVPEDFLERARVECAGNPLLLGEVAAAWARGEDLLGSSGGSLAERVFLPRFAGVGRPALRWARSASVFGTRFRPLLAGRLAGQTEAEGEAALEALCAAGLMRGARSGGGAEFVHPLVRQALYEDMAEPVRQGMHATAFRLLRGSGAEPAEIAPHALGAQLSGDEDAVAVLTAAGMAALAVGAMATAAEHLGSAVRLAGPAAPAGLRIELARAQLSMGRVGQAEETARRLIDEVDPAGAERVAGLRLLAQVLLASGRQPEARRRADQASELAARFDADLGAEVLLDAAFAGWLFAGLQETRATTRRALSMIEASGTANEALRLAATSADGYVAVLGGDPSALDAIARAGRAELDARNAGQVRAAWSWDILFGYAHLAKVAERFDDCDLCFDSLIGTAKHQGAMLTYHTLAVNYADALWRTGRLRAAHGLLTGAAELSELIPALAPFACVGLAHVCLELGNDDESATWAGRVEALMSRIGESPYLRLWLSMFACRNQLRAGRVDQAVAAAELAANTAQDAGILEPCIVPWHGAAIEAHVAAGQLDRAEALVVALEEICARVHCRAPRAVAAAGRATIAWRRGGTEAADDLYRQALVHNAAVPMPLAEAETLIAYARFLRHTGSRGGARDVLHRALEILEPTAAGRLQAIAAEELAIAGGRRRQPRSPRTLTAQEQRVASLAAAGLSNRQIAAGLFLSVKTVDHHLQRVYAKLGISSRRELIGRARESAQR